MLGVVLVDDEALVRVDLRSMIDWENEGFTILGEAENGQRGLELILRHRPDIVITDIKMPVLDGLEMIRAAGAEYDGARYVVLSSYEEFGLLKSAMNLGVADYLLKLELTPGALRETLETQKRALARERKGTGLRGISPATRATRILRRTLAGQPPGEEGVAAALKAANPKMDTGALACAAVRFALPARRAFDASDRRTVETAAHGIVGDIGASYFDGMAFLAGDGLCLYLYTPREESDPAEMGEVVIGMLRQYLNVPSVVGISGFSGGLAEVSAIMKDALQATEEAFYAGYGKVLRVHGKVETTPGPSPVYDWPERLTRVLELRSTDDLRAVFAKLRPLLAGRIARNDAYNLCFTIVFLSLSVLKKSEDSKGLFAENLYEIIGGIGTLEGLREWMDTFEGSLLELLASIPEKTGDDAIVTAAKRFIAENCRGPISLNMVAEHLSISAGYLSSVFKRAANVGFVEYVTKVKIAEAKTLLLSGKYKIYEVSEMVGYDDNSYFSKTFHKVTGLTPKEYITRHS